MSDPRNAERVEREAAQLAQALLTAAKRRGGRRTAPGTKGAGADPTGTIRAADAVPESKGAATGGSAAPTEKFGPGVDPASEYATWPGDEEADPSDGLGYERSPYDDPAGWDVPDHDRRGTDGALADLVTGAAFLVKGGVEALGGAMARLAAAGLVDGTGGGRRRVADEGQATERPRFARPHRVDVPVVDKDSPA